jgi:hypothetical protein
MIRTRFLRPLAALAVLAVISVGCSTAPAGSGTGSTGGTASADPAETTTGGVGGTPGGASESVTPQAQAVKFAQCMRKNGVKGFPDPDSSGRLTLDGVVNGSSLDPDSAAWKKAITACRDLQPAGFAGTTRTPEQQQGALKFAQCIREHGVTDFPDPDPDAPMVDTNLIPSTNEPGGMSVLNAAMKSCSAEAAGAGVHP